MTDDSPPFDRITAIAPEALTPGAATPGVVRETAFHVPEVATQMRARAEPNAASGWHHHGNHDVFGYVVRGGARFEFGYEGQEEATEVEEGGMFLVPAYLIHRDVNPSDEPQEIILTLVGEGPMVVNVDGPDKDPARWNPDIRALRELPFHARVIKYDLSKSISHFDDGSWTSMSDIGKSFNGEVLTAEAYAAVEQAHIDALREMADESGVHELRRLERDHAVPLDEALEDVRARLRDKSDGWLWLAPDRTFYIDVADDYHVHCGSHRECVRGLALARARGLHPLAGGPGLLTEF